MINIICISLGVQSKYTAFILDVCNFEKQEYTVVEGDRVELKLKLSRKVSPPPRVYFTYSPDIIYGATCELFIVNS